MGAAKRQTQRRAERERFSQPMKPARFNLFAIGSRRSPTRLVSRECSYWSDPKEQVLGTVFFDLCDFEIAISLRRLPQRLCALLTAGGFRVASHAGDFRSRA
jgi:hypothetical protein